jgi:hypothetical protein
MIYVAQERLTNEKDGVMAVKVKDWNKENFCVEKVGVSDSGGTLTCHILQVGQVRNEINLKHKTIPFTDDPLNMLLVGMCVIISNTE